MRAHKRGACLDCEPCTAKLYDRTGDEDEVERIAI
jgi:hypothetical protein